MPHRRGKRTREDPFHNRIHCMVLPYFKGLMVIKEIFHIVLVYLLWFFCIQSLVLNNWYHSTFLGRSCGQLFFIFADFFVQRRKKRVATFQTFSVYFCEKFAEKDCRSEFLSEKHPIWKKKSSRTESGRSRYCGFKICNFSGFFLRTAAWFVFIFVAFEGRICQNKLQIWVILTISPNFKKKISRNGVREVKL